MKRIDIVITPNAPIQASDDALNAPKLPHPAKFTQCFRHAVGDYNVAPVFCRHPSWAITSPSAKQMKRIVNGALRPMARKFMRSMCAAGNPVKSINIIVWLDSVPFVDIVR